MKYFRCLFLFIIMFLIPFYNCLALTKEQQDNIATYARELIEKGNARKASDGTPLLKYGSGSTRLPAFSDELYNGHFVFNCDSFVSYVLHHTYGIPIIKSWGTPWTCANYQDGGFTGEIMKNIKSGSYSKIVSYLEKGDIILCGPSPKDGKWNATHVFFYIGDGYIAQAKSGGLVVQTFDSYAGSYGYYRIVRVLDTAPTKEVDMSIVWPDTKEVEILGYDAFPEVNITYDKQISTKVLVKFSFEDDKNLQGYTINQTNSLENLVPLSGKTYSLEQEISENGTYYVLVKDSKGQVTRKNFTIDFLDYTPPHIDNLTFNYNQDQTFNISILASDTNSLTFSLDGITYNESSEFRNLIYNNYTIYVKDIAGNVTTKSIDLTKDHLQMVEISYDEDYKKTLNVHLNFNLQSNISGYNVTNTLNKPTTWLPIESENLDYKIEKNGVYYIWTINNDGVYLYQEVIINNLDQTPPKLEKIIINKQKNNVFTLTVVASDLQCGISGYSLDNIVYQESNIFEKLSYQTYHIYIKDKCDNVTFYQYNAFNDTNNNNDDFVSIIVIIIILIILVISYQLLKRKKVK